LLSRSSSLAVKNQYRQAVTPNTPYTLQANYTTDHHVLRNRQREPSLMQVIDSREQVMCCFVARAEQPLRPDPHVRCDPHLDSIANMGLQRKVSSVPNTRTRTCTSNTAATHDCMYGRDTTVKWYACST
jgi:hypothetical protein